MLLQAQTATTIIGPSKAIAGASCFSLTVIVTYPASAVQRSFFDPAAAALGSVAPAVSGPQTFAINSSAMTVHLPPSRSRTQAHGQEGLPMTPTILLLLSKSMHSDYAQTCAHDCITAAADSF